MKNLLKVACIAAMLILASCSPKQKSNEIWFKVSEKNAEYDDLVRYLKKTFKKKHGWYVLEFAESEEEDNVELNFISLLYDLDNNNNNKIWRLGYIITDIILPPSITGIDSESFAGCTLLKSINIPSSVQYIGDNAFEGAFRGADVNIQVDNNNTNIIVNKRTNTLIWGCSKTLIPSTITRIGASAFKDCDKLESITIPSSVWSIGESAFNGCNNLREINIPSSVNFIGAAAFKDCDKLESITIPSSVLSIGAAAFKDCDKLESITIPSSVDFIGESAFNGCDNLRSVYIPSSVLSIGAAAFKDCDKLESITIPSSVDFIGAYAFEDCDKLESITIPSSVKTIDDYAFYGCDNLRSVYILSGGIKVGDNAFGGCSKLRFIEVPRNLSIGMAFRSNEVLPLIIKSDVIAYY